MGNIGVGGGGGSYPVGPFKNASNPQRGKITLTPKKRSPHPDRLKAHEIAKQLYTPSTIATIINYAQLYANHVKDRKILLQDTLTYRFCVYDYVSRFSDRYREKTRPKIYERVQRTFQKARSRSRSKIYTTMITLTLSPENYNTLYHAYQNLSKGSHSLLTSLKKAYGQDLLGYISIPEVGSNSNRLHRHVMVFHLNRWISVERVLSQKLRQTKTGRIRGSYDLGSVKLKRRTWDLNGKKTLSHCINYCLKYITKTTRGGSEVLVEGNSIRFTTLAVFWSLNAKTFSSNSEKLRGRHASRVILENAQRTSATFQSRWIYLGSYPADYLPVPQGVYEYSALVPYIAQVEGLTNTNDFPDSGLSELYLGF
jgi:hypothetical protein